MKFQLTLNVEVPEPLASAIPHNRQRQVEFQEVVDAAVAAAVTAWAESQQGADGPDVPTNDVH